MDLKFAHQARTMAVHCFGAYTELFSDPVVGKAPRNTLQDLAFTVGKLGCLPGKLKQLLDVGRNDFPALKNFMDTGRDFRRRCVFQKQTVHTRPDELFEHGCRRHAGQDSNLCLRRPFAAFHEYFKTVCTRHGKIDDGAIRLKAFDLGNRINTVVDGTYNFIARMVGNEPVHALDRERMIVGNQNGFGHATLRAGKARGQFAPKIVLLTALFYLLALHSTTVALGQSQTVLLDGPKGSEELQPYISYYLDEKWERTIPEIMGDYASRFKPIETKDPDFGYTDAKIWLRLDFENQTGLTEDWRLYFKENFKQIFDVYVIRENFSVENVLSQDLERGFASRPIQYPELVAPILIKPGTQVTVLVNYWSEGASYIQLSMETATSFAQIASGRTAKNFIYYGMMCLLLATSLLALVIYRHKVFAAYFAYAGSTLLFLMHSDGVTYQYLWPAFPGFNSSASIYLGSGIIVSACTYAKVFLVTHKRHPWIDKWLLAIIAATLALVATSFFADKQEIKKILVLMSLITVLSCLFSTIVAALNRFKEVRFFLFAWVGIVLAAIVMNLRHLLGVEISQDFQHDFMRFVMVLDAAMMGLAIADRYNQLLIARQHAMRTNLVAAERNLQLSTRLNELERQFTAAQMASARDRSMENTIHDLKQPLNALRLKVHSLMQDTDGGNSSDVENTFEYLEGLIMSHLEQEKSEKKQYIDEGSSQKPSDLDLNEVLGSVHEMFLTDAQEKELEFRYVPTTMQTSLPSLVLMRLATNLVSNAIKYTASGKILLGCRRSGHMIRVEVHDTGTGMTEQQFSKAFRRKTRLDGAPEIAEGNGYGLSIVGELCQKHGLTISRCPDRTTGFGIAILIPACNP